jgi:hypothetical protein
VPIYIKWSSQSGPSTISGNLGGKQVNCAVRQVQGGFLPPGTYHISVPIKDPIHGTMAQVTPVEVRGYDPAKKKEIVGTSAKLHMPTAISAYKPHGLSADVVTEKVGADHTVHGQMFVLCDKPVIGRNTLVVSMGFADLMEALQISGGATFTIG